MAAGVAVIVNVLLPLPGVAILAGVKFAVTPVGKPLTDKATGAWNPFAPAVDNLTEVALPGRTDAVVAAVVRVRLGGRDTVRVMGCAFVTPAPAAVTVRV